LSNADHLVLVIEDEQDLSHLVRVNLELAGYRVEAAYNGAEGLSKARQVAPALILLDVMMPVLDGWNVLRALKEDEQLRDVPVIMLTALSEERDLIRGHLQGAVRYVTKPFEMKQLLGAVESALQPETDEELAARRTKIRGLLQRLAELDSGRAAGANPVRLSRLEQPPPPPPTEPEPTNAERDRVNLLTDKQRYIADQLAGGRSARDLAAELGVSRSNVYATRKRVARKLSVSPDDVATEAKRLGLGATDDQ
jgi:CheY-like chemotaxis protein/DNA-binding CsgD family transcriptional regulator